MTKTFAPRLAALLLSATALSQPLPAFAQQGGAALNYEDADLRAVADDISIRTGRTFVIDPTLSGTVNIISPADANLTPEEVWKVFQATLRLNGFTAVPIGDNEYTIVRSQQALREAGSGVETAQADAVTRLVPLRFIDVREAQNAVRSLIADTGLVTAVTETNTLIVADTGANVERVVNLLNELDVDNTVVRSVTLQNAPASEVANTLLEIVSSQPVEGRRSAAVSVVPIDATNQVVLRGNPQEVSRLLPIIDELDTAGSSRVGFDAIYLNHANAEKVVEILQTLLGDQVTGEGAAPPGAGFGGPRTAISFDMATNAVIVNAPPDTQRLVRSIVSRLDIRRPQVLIEAVIVEISNSTARDLGVQYFAGGENFPPTATNFGGNQPNLFAAAGAAYFLGPGGDDVGNNRSVTVENGTVVQEANNEQLNQLANTLIEAAVGDLLGTTGFLTGWGDTTDDGDIYGVLIQALQQDGESNILSTPSVVVVDNETARLQVGQEIPIVTGRATGDDFQGGVFTNVERKDVGNILEVTPQINEGNTVQLEIELEVSSIGAFTGVEGNIITNESVIKTVAIAEDGETLILGGLIDNDERDSESKVPFLGDIPGIGNLFKATSRSREDTTLMIFIRPTIIRDQFTAAAATARKYDYVTQQQMRRQRRGTDPAIGRVLENYVGTGLEDDPSGFRTVPAGRYDAPVTGEAAPGVPGAEETGLEQ